MSEGDTGMLRVNTAKISAEEFAKKYGLDEYCELEGYYSKFDHNLVVQPDSSIWIFGIREMKTSQEPKELSLLFDMISNGDVIKEAAE
jgi:hypothetical protein